MIKKILKKLEIIIIFLLSYISIYSQTNCKGFDANDFVFNGKASVTGSNEVTLTPDSNNVYGTLWSQQKVLFSQDFTIDADLFLGSTDGPGADGIVFVIQPLSSNSGEAGFGMGYHGISPSFAIEFDTWFNSGMDPITNDHVALMKNGDVVNHSTIAPYIDLGNIEDGKWHRTLIEWKAAAKTLKLTFDGVVLYNLSVDLKSIFLNNDSVFWGFTAATGAAKNLQKVKIYNYCVTYASSAAPTGNATQVFCAFPAPTLANLSAVGNNIKWYASAVGGVPLPAETLLLDGTMYYATQTIDGVESNDRLAVKAIINNPQITASATEVCAGESVSLKAGEDLPTICNMNITLTKIPLGDPIPGFTYKGKYNGHYYYVYNNPTTWTQGEAICRANGGYLVCINDINENDFVSNLTNNNIWIGMFRDSKTGNFRWLDCMNITFTNWRPGEPNSGPFGEPYVQIIRGCSYGLNTWNNLDDNSANGSCYSNMVPIMEIDPSIYNNSSGLSTSYLWSTGETTPTISVTPSKTTDYWVDVTINGVTCRKTITITVNSKITPTFNSVEPICAGSTLPTLPTTSLNGVKGTWSPALNNTTTTTYTFTPDAGQCADSVSMTITVNPVPAAPTGNLVQVFCGSPVATVSNLTATGSNIKWYTTATGGTALSDTTSLLDGISYYASQTIDGCESRDRLAVKVIINNPQITANATEVCAGTAVQLSVDNVKGSTAGWKLLIPSSQYNGSLLNLSETGYDRTNNIIYSLYKGSALTFYAFNLNNNTVSTVNTTNIPASIGPFTFDDANKRIIAGRTGRESLYAIPTSGGAWSQVSAGSSDMESYGAQYFWNSKNNKVAFFGGYGLYSVKNWVWENGGNWTNVYANNTICNTANPAKRNTQLALSAPGENKIFFFSGQGSCSGDQFAKSCTSGSGWATDVGVYCWLKDLWSLDLNTYTFSNLLPVNHSSITKEGTFTYNYKSNTFYILGGYVPSSVYSPSYYNTANFENTVLKYTPGIDTGFVPISIKGTPPPLVSVNNMGINKAYFDETNNQVVWIRKDGVWAIDLNDETTVSYLWSTGETTPSVSVTPSKTSDYWVDVTINGVTCRKNITITVNPKITPTFTPVAPICAGSTLSALPTTSLNGVKGTWSPALNNTTTTTYTFTPDADQCALTTTMTVVVNPKISPTFNSVEPICAGSTLPTLPTTSLNGVKGTWSPALNNTTTTTYTFTPDADQCALTTTMTVVVNPKISPTFNSVEPICAGSTLPTLPTTSLNGVKGTWSPALNNTTTTTYTFTPDADQCALTTTMTVVVNPKISPTFNSVEPICAGSTLPTLPTTSLNGVKGTWSPALNNTTTTTYTFTPDADQCALTTTMTVVVNPKISPTFNSVEPICAGSTLPTLPTTSLNGVKGTWSPALNNTTTTTYTFTPDADQCALTTTMTVVVNPKISPTFNSVEPICAGSTLPTLPTTSLNGVKGTWSPALNNTTTTTYTFTPDADQCALTTTMTVVVNPKISPTFNSVEPICAGSTLPTLPTTSLNGVKGTWSPALNNTTTTTYTFTPDADQCALTTTMTVVVNPKISPTFNSVEPICAGSTLPTLPTTSLNGVKGTWSPALNNTTTTTYTFTPDADQCALTTTMTVVVNPKISPTFNSVEPICAGSTLPTLPTTSLNGVKGTWSPALNNTTTTTYTFTPDADQCALTTTMTVVVNPKISPTFNSVEPICAGSTLPTLPTTSLNGVKGTWSPALNNTTTTTYTFTPDADQCALTTTMTVVVNPKISPTFNSVEPICAGSTLPTLPTTSLNGVKGTWSPALNNTTTTTYTFTPDSNYCASSTEMTIQVNPVEDIKYRLTTSGNNIIVEVINFDSSIFEYSIDNVNWQIFHIFNNLPNNNYKIYIRNKTGCIVSIGDILLLNVPNAITPNDDGINDKWTIPGIEKYPKSKITVLDRFGNVVLEKIVGNNFYWDGKFLLRPLPTGTYWYIIKLDNGTEIKGYLLIKNRN